MAQSTIAKLGIVIGANTKQFESALQRSNRKLSAFGKSAANTGKSLMVGVTAPLAAMGAIGVKTFASFEQAMAKVNAVSGATQSQFNSLKKLALDLGANTRFSAAEVAELQLNYSKLGLSAPQIEKVAAATLNLALATGEDLARSATVAAATMKGFGMEASDMGQITDVMAKSFSSSALDLEKFSTAMAVLAPAAKNAGFSIEDTTGLLSVLVDRGVDASTAGTALRNIFLDLSKSGMSFDQAMAAINGSTNKNAKALDLFGKRGATVANILASNRGEANELADSYRNSAGAAKAMADIMDNTLEGSMKKVTSALQAMFISIGEALSPAIKTMGAIIANLASGFAGLSPNVKRTVVILAALAAAVGPLLFGVGKFITLIPVLKAGFATMLGPVGLVILAVAALGAAFVIMAGQASAAEAAQNAINEVGVRAAKAISQEKSELEQLVAIARDDTKSREARLKAIKKINQISPEYLGNITLENIATNDGAKAIEKYTTALEKRAKAQAAHERLVEIEKELLDVQEQIRKSHGADDWETVKNVIGTVTGGMGLFVDTTASLVSESKRLNAQKAALLGFLIEEETAIDKNTDELNENKEAVGNLARSLVDLKALKPTQLEFEPMPWAKRGYTAAWFQSELDKAGEPQLKIGVSPLYSVLQPQFTAIETAWAQLTGRMEAEWTQKTLNIKDRTAQIAADAGQLLGQVSAILAQGHQNAMDNLDQYHERELENINSSRDSAVKKEQRIVALNAATEKKRRELTIKRAKHEKNVAVMNAIISTATAVAQALPNYILAGAVAALGAAQIALIAGTPVPALAKGGLAFGPTLAMVGDNPGASSNPEVIAPLDKLKNMIGGGSQNVVVSVKDIILDGAQLRMVLDASDRLNHNTY